MSCGFDTARGNTITWYGPGHNGSQAPNTPCQRTSQISIRNHDPQSQTSGWFASRSWSTVQGNLANGRVLRIPAQVQKFVSRWRPHHFLCKIFDVDSTQHRGEFVRRLRPRDFDREAVRPGGRPRALGRIHDGTVGPSVRQPADRLRGVAHCGKRTTVAGGHHEG